MDGLLLSPKVTFLNARLQRTWDVHIVKRSRKFRDVSVHKGWSQKPLCDLEALRQHCLRNHSVTNSRLRITSHYQCHLRQSVAPSRNAAWNCVALWGSQTSTQLRWTAGLWNCVLWSGESTFQLVFWRKKTVLCTKDENLPDCYLWKVQNLL